MVSQTLERVIKDTVKTEISFDNLFKNGGLDGVYYTIEEAFNGFSDRSKLFQPGTYFIVYINCKDSMAVDKKIMGFLCRQFVRFKRMTMVFQKLTNQSKRKIFRLLSDIKQESKINFFTLNGAPGKISEDLQIGSIYLNRYAPSKKIS